MKKSRKYIAAIIFVVLIASYSIYLSKTKLTYLEYSSLNSYNDTYIQVVSTDEELRQEFIMPYSIFNGISIQIGTYARDNNSIWNISIVEKNSGKIICQDDFNASLISDNQYQLYQFNKNYTVNKGEKYELVIRPVEVNEQTSLAFYCSEESQIEDSVFMVNGEEQAGDLCISVYGGDTDLWWTGYYLFLAGYLMLLLLVGINTISHKRKLFDNKVFSALLLAAFVFVLLCSFSVSSTFTDENDNMRGGMVIANGGVLYRDYVTQHTPVVYYLCGIFAMLGAGSIQQFRLSYYIFEAMVWAFLYIRHSESIGEKKMFFLPIIESVFISSIISPQGYQILSDGFQGLCTVTILLEFLMYFKDRKLGWDRCTIVSCCLWGSFGSAFVSAYALVWIALVVLALEIQYTIRESLRFRQVICRYYKLVVAVIAPLTIAIIYFKLNHSLRRAFEQFYTFNKEVYSQYTGGFGENLAEPMIDAVKNFFNIIASNFNSIVTSTASNVIILQLIISVVAVSTIIGMLLKKQYIVPLLFLIVMCCSATRGYGFHGLAAWYVAILIIVVMGEHVAQYNRITYTVAGLVGIFLLSTYVNAVAGNLLYEQSAISEMDMQIIALTSDDEDILIDAYCDDSLYLCYKGRYPANRAVYMLAWYMDWFEQDTIDDLINKNPHIVVYNEGISVWGYTYYSNAFLAKLKENYTRISDNPDEGWKYYVWIKNE